MKSAITFQGNRQVNIVTTLSEVLQEINHYQAYYYTRKGNLTEYTNKTGTAIIKIYNLSQDEFKILSKAISNIN